MWPAIAGGAYRLGGFAAARLLALVCLVAGVALAHDATRRLLGPAPALGAAVVIFLRGSSLILAHYATYDLGAFAFVALAFWCVTRWSEAPGRGWAVAAGLALWLGALTKYAYAAMGLPLVVMMWSLGGPTRRRDAALFTVAAAVPFLASMQALFGQWIPPTLGNYDHATFSRALVAVVMGAYVAVPLGFAVWGLRRSGGADARVTALLRVGVLSLLLWPGLHVMSAQIASGFKHVWLGVLLAAPAVGYGFHRVWASAGRGLRTALVSGLAVVGLLEWVALEPMTYPHFRPSVDFLLERVQPGDDVYVVGDNDRWVYAMYLYAEGRVGSPFDVVDQGAEELEATCAYEWVVSTRTEVTGALDASGWACSYDLVFEKGQRFLNYRGTFDTQTFQVYRRGG